MKIVITGSLGNISKPLAKSLLNNVHTVTVVSHSEERRAEIEALGAQAAIGSLADTDFLTQTFSGNDAVYTMIPPNNYFDHQLDLISYYEKLGNNYATALANAEVNRAVHLSSIGAHLAFGNGILKGAHRVEQILKKVGNISITFLRPTSFYYNLLGHISGIKAHDTIFSNYGSENTIPWVSPLDIAVAIEEELTKPIGQEIRYVASEELSGNATAKVLGDAIGKPNLQWKPISDEETLAGLINIGMNPKIASGLVEVYAALRNGLLAEDYNLNRPAKMGNVKLEDYAKEFAAIYKAQTC